MTQAQAAALAAGRAKILEVRDCGSSVPGVQDIFQKAVNRLVFGAQRYGTVDPADWDFLASADERIARYQATGNTEWLIDALNYVLLEAVWPHHPDAHFEATTADDSPGSAKRDGSWTSAPPV